jgi:hypothetical protein
MKQASQATDLESPKKWNWWEKPLLVFLLSLPVLLVVFVVYYNVSTFYNLWGHHAVEERGIPTKGVIYKLSSSPSTTRSAESYDIAYRYTVDGKEYRKKRAVESYFFSYREIGDSLDILYLPDRPVMSDINDNSVPAIDVFICILLDITLVIMAFKIKAESRKAKQAAENTLPSRDSSH